MDSIDTAVGKVIASVYRKKLLMALAESTMTPSQIADTTELNRTHVSRYLRELGDYGLVKCAAPTLRKGKLYSITELGLATLKRVSDLESKAKR